MLSFKQAGEILGLSALRIKQIAKENNLRLEHTDYNNGMAKVPPESMTALLKIRKIQLTRKRVIIKQQKGGVGGTTLSLLVAMRLAQKGVKVLYIDLDSEANGTSFLAKEDLVIAQADTFLEIFKAEIEAKKQIAKDCIVESRFQNISLIPAKGLLRRVDRILLDKNPKHLMDKVLNGIEADFDLIIMDIPPTYTRLTESAYLAADLVILPYDTSSFSIEGVQLTYEDIQDSLREFEVKKPIEIRVLMNKYSPMTTASRDAFISMAKIMKDHILPFTIKTSADVINCINEGKSLYEIKSNAEIRANIEELCDFIVPIKKAAAELEK